MSEPAASWEVTQRPPHIVVVDDDRAMREILRSCLEAENYRVSEAANSAQLDQAMANGDVDLVTLDIGLGAEDGVALARKLRDRSEVGIIMVTAREDLVEKVLSLEMGADDYITKPFHLREVTARVKSLLRRRNGDGPTTQPGERLVFSGWVLNSSQRQLVSPDGMPCPLTTGEYELLELLVQNPQRVLSRDQILEHLRGPHWIANDRVVDNQIGRLRRRMEEVGGGDTPIQSVRGVGYVLAARVVPVRDDAALPVVRGPGKTDG